MSHLPLRLPPYSADCLELEPVSDEHRTEMPFGQL